LADVANQAGGFVAPTGLMHLYLARFFGLPRWARYTDGPAGRLPRSPRGIPILSTTAPDSKGEPSSPLVVPTSFGFAGATTTDAVCVNTHFLPGVFVAGGRPHSDGEWIYLNTSKRGSTSGGPPDLPIVTGVVDASLIKFTFVAGTNFPLNAKRIKVSAQLVYTFAGAGSYQNFAHLLPTGLGLVVGTQVYSDSSNETTGGGKNLDAVYDVPLLSSNDGVTATANIVVAHSPNITGGVFSAARASVIAYTA